MASQTSALPDGSTLTKPAYTDSADIAVINTNMDKIVSNINAENQALANKVNPIYNAPTETFNGDLDTLTTPGWYVLGTSATNAPPITASGRLLVAQMGTSPYIRQTYYCGYDNRIFTRVRSYYNNAWHWFEWQQLVLKSDIISANVTGTTTANGNLQLPIAYWEGIPLVVKLKRTSDNGNLYTVIGRWGTDDSQGNWGCKCYGETEASGLQKSVAVTGVLYYYKF